jgi:hypothetical protein
VAKLWNSRGSNCSKRLALSSEIAPHFSQAGLLCIRLWASVGRAVFIHCSFTFASRRGMNSNTAQHVSTCKLLMQPRQQLQAEMQRDVLLSVPNHSQLFSSCNVLQSDEHKTQAQGGTGNHATMNAYESEVHDHVLCSCVVFINMLLCAMFCPKACGPWPLRLSAPPSS